MKQTIKMNAPFQWVAMMLLALALVSPAFAVPDKVEKEFEDRYENAEDVEWKVDSNGYWEAEYELDGRDYRADFEEGGTWIETERSIDFEDLPEAIQDAVRDKYGDKKIAEVEEVQSAKKGSFYDVEFDEKGPNLDVEFAPNGQLLESLNPNGRSTTPDLGGSQDGTVGGESVNPMMPSLNSKLPKIEDNQTSLKDMTFGNILMEFGVNLITILIYAYGIYYLRHHNHKMMFLLLAFNLFLFPIFLLSSVLTMGFGFTIFALLALVRLRSENFDKAEVAYLLGAVALTFINSQLAAKMEILATGIVLLTAYLADHPKLWSSAYQTTQVRYKISDTRLMLDRDHLTKVISEEFKILVNAIEINEVVKNEVRLTVVYSDPESPSLTSKQRKKLEAANEEKNQKS